MENLQRALYLQTKTDLKFLLVGPARSLGGVIIGYLGARVFNPQPVSKVMETVGGCHVMLGLIAMAHNMEFLYAGVKALVCVIKSNDVSR